MTPDVRRVREDELPQFIDAVSTGFLERPDIPRVVEEVRPLWDLDRVWAAFEGGRACGTFRSWATELTVPGGARLPAAAVAGVTVLPTHRRRGILRAMAAAEHAASRERGETAALLYASEYPIYGNLGYGPACRVATWTVAAHETGWHSGPVMGVSMAVVDEATRDAMKAVFEAWRRRQPGEMRRREFSWDYDLGLRDTAWGKRWQGYVALRRDGAGRVDGYVRYRAEEKWERRQPRCTLVVEELHALTDEAYAALWRFLAEVDLVATLRAETRSPAERLPWLLTNARAASVSDVGDGMWVRLFDLPRALEARAYERAARLVLEVVDPEARGGRHRLLLDASRDGATCRPTDRSPDVTFHVAALGAAYLGGSRLRLAAAAHGADEHRPGALAEADALLATTDEPWCSTFF